MHGLPTVGNVNNCEVTGLCLNEYVGFRAAQFNKLHHVAITASYAPILMEAFSYENRIKSVALTCRGFITNLGVGISATNFSWCIGLTAGTGLNYFKDVYIQTSGQWIVATGTGGYFEGFYSGGFRSDVPIQGAFLAIQGVDGYADPVVLKAFNPSDEGNVNTTVALVYLFGVGPVNIEGSILGLSPTYTPGTAPTVSINACESVTIDGAIGRGATSAGLFAMSGQTKPVRVRGYQWPSSGGTWMDPANPGPLLLEDYAMTITSVALSGTTATVSGNTFLACKELKFTGALTGDCTVTVPFITVPGFERRYRNATTGGHNVIIQGATGGSITVAPGAVYTGVHDGTNIV